MADKNTQRIDRLSNYSLTIGLKNGTTLTSANNLLTVDRLISYGRAQSAINDSTNGSVLVDKFYVDGVKTTLTQKMSYLLENQIKGSARITPVYTNMGGNEYVTLNLKGPYGSETEDKMITGVTTDSTGNDINRPSSTSWYSIPTGTKYAVFTGQTDAMAYGTFAAQNSWANSGSGAVITAIKVDENGSVIGVDYKKISTSDLDNTGGAYDRYTGWTLVTNNTETNVNGYGNYTKDNASEAADAITKVQLIGEGIVINTNVTGSNEFNDSDNTFTFNKVQTVTLSPQVDGNIIIQDQNSHQITHATKPDVISAKSSGLFGAGGTEPALLKGLVDDYGHISKLVPFDATDIGIPSYTGGAPGLVHSPETEGNTSFVETSPTTETKFYTSSGKWATIPYNAVKIASDSSSTALSIVATGSNKDLTDLKHISSITVRSDGTLTANYFSGNGGSLTGLNATNITTGTLDTARLPIVPIANGGFGRALSTNTTETTHDANALLILQENNDNQYTFEAVRASSSGTGTYVLTQEAGSNVRNNKIQFKSLSELISDHLGNLDAFVFKGTIGTATTDTIQVDNSTKIINLHEALLDKNYSAGWTFKATDSFKIKDSETTGNSYDYIVEPGDLIVAVLDYNVAGYPKFNVSQVNIDGAVSAVPGITVTATEASTELVGFGSSDGRTVKGTGVTVSNNNGSMHISAEAASAEKLSTAVNIWGVSFDGSEDLTYESDMTVGNIIPDSSDSNNYTVDAETGKKTTKFNIGSASVEFDNIYAAHFNGHLEGSAAEADVAKKTQGTLKVGTFVFDGSEDKELDISALDGISKVEFAHKANLANNEFINDITASASGSTVTLTPTYFTATRSIAFDLFNISDNAGDVTVTPFTTAQTAKFYKLSTDNILRYGSILGATKFIAKYTIDSNDYDMDVTTAIPVITADDAKNFENNKKNILIADYTEVQGGTSYYKYEASNITVLDSTDLNKSATAIKSDTVIPTGQAVTNYVTTNISNLSKTSVKTVDLLFDSNTTNESGTLVASTDSFDADTVIRRIAVEVRSATSSSAHPGLVVTMGEETLMSADENDLSEKGLYISDVYYTTASASDIRASLSSADSTALGALAAIVHIDYVTAN